MTETDTTKRPRPIDALIADPSGMAALCDESEFADILEWMVADEAPRLFAIVQEYGERVDARVAAWGMAFEECTKVIGVDGGVFMSLITPDRALRAFRMGSHVRTRLVWVNPDAATPAEADDLTDSP